MTSHSLVSHPLPIPGSSAGKLLLATAIFTCGVGVRKGYNEFRQDGRRQSEVVRSPQESGDLSDPSSSGSANISLLADFRIGDGSNFRKSAIEPLTQEEQRELEQLSAEVAQLQQDLEWYKCEGQKLAAEQVVLKGRIYEWVEALGDVAKDDVLLFCDLEVLRQQSEGSFLHLDSESINKLRAFGWWLYRFPMHLSVEEALAVSNVVAYDELISSLNRAFPDVVSIIGKDRILQELSGDQLLQVAKLAGLKLFTELFGEEGLAIIRLHDPELYQQYYYKEYYGIDIPSNTEELDG